MIGWKNSGKRHVDGWRNPFWHYGKDDNSGEKMRDKISKILEFICMGIFTSPPPLAGDAIYPPLAGDVIYPPLAGDAIYPPLAGDVIYPPLAGDAIYPPLAGDVIYPPLAGVKNSLPHRLRGGQGGGVSAQQKQPHPTSQRSEHRPNTEHRTPSTEHSTQHTSMTPSPQIRKTSFLEFIAPPASRRGEMIVHSASRRGVGILAMFVVIITMNVVMIGDASADNSYHSSNSSTPPWSGASVSGKNCDIEPHWHPSGSIRTENPSCVAQIGCTCYSRTVQWGTGNLDCMFTCSVVTCSPKICAFAGDTCCTPPAPPGIIPCPGICDDSPAVIDVGDVYNHATYWKCNKKLVTAVEPAGCTVGCYTISGTGTKGDSTSWDCTTSFSACKPNSPKFIEDGGTCNHCQEPTKSSTTPSVWDCNTVWDCPLNIPPICNGCQDTVLGDCNTPPDYDVTCADTFAPPTNDLSLCQGFHLPLEMTACGDPTPDLITLNGDPTKYDYQYEVIPPPSACEDCSDASIPNKTYCLSHCYDCGTCEEPIIAVDAAPYDCNNTYTCEMVYPVMDTVSCLADCTAVKGDPNPTTGRYNPADKSLAACESPECKHHNFLADCRELPCIQLSTGVTCTSDPSSTFCVNLPYHGCILPTPPAALIAPIEVGCGKQVIVNAGSVQHWDGSSGTTPALIAGDPPIIKDVYPGFTNKIVSCMTDIVKESVLVPRLDDITAKTKEIVSAVLMIYIGFLGIRIALGNPK